MLACCDARAAEPNGSTSWRRSRCRIDARGAVPNRVIRETVLMDTTGAMKAYAEVMRLHPGTAWSDMAADASKRLTFSKEQFIRALEQWQEDSRP